MFTTDMGMTIITTRQTCTARCRVIMRGQSPNIIARKTCEPKGRAYLSGKLAR